MQIKPHVLETTNFMELYPGGNYNPEKLKMNKRGEIKEFSRDSQKRLCLTIDSIKYFNPRIQIEFKIFNNQKSSFKEIKALCRKLSNPRYSKHYVTYIKPLFIWRKIKSNHYLLITNLNSELPYLVFKSVIKDTLIKLYKTNQFDLSVINLTNQKKAKIIYDFTLIDDIESNEQNQRFWGVINGSYYTKKKISTKIISKKELKNKKKDTTLTKPKQIKKNFYMKNK